MAGKKYRSGILAGCGLAAASALAMGNSAKAATLYTTGFESSQGFASGSYLTGQGYGTPFTSGVTSDVVSEQGTGVVAPYASPVIGNVQYAQLNDLNGISATTSAFYYPNLSSIAPVSAGTPVVDSVVQLAVGSGSAGAAFGLTAFGGSSGAPIADFEVNAATGVLTVDGVGVGGTTPILVTSYTAPTGYTYENYELQLNYANSTYNVYQAPVGSTVFTNEIAAAIPFETPAGGIYTTTAIDTVGVGSGGTGLAEFDNFTISTNAAVPEPTSASLILGGLVVAGVRRRRRSSAR